MEIYLKFINKIENLGLNKIILDKLAQFNMNFKANMMFLI